MLFALLQCTWGLFTRHQDFDPWLVPSANPSPSQPSFHGVNLQHIFGFGARTTCGVLLMERSPSDCKDHPNHGQPMADVKALRMSNLHWMRVCFALGSDELQVLYKLVVFALKTSRANLTPGHVCAQTAKRTLENCLHVRVGHRFGFWVFWASIFGFNLRFLYSNIFFFSFIDTCMQRKKLAGTPTMCFCTFGPHDPHEIYSKVWCALLGVLYCFHLPFGPFSNSWSWTTEDICTKVFARSCPLSLHAITCICTWNLTSFRKTLETSAPSGED